MPSTEVVKPPKLQMRMSRNEDGSSITVIYEGKSYDATDQHPNWNAIVAGALADDPSVIDLFDIGESIGIRNRLSDRFSYADGVVYFDGDPLSGDLADGIMHFVKEGEDPQVLVNFAERLFNNPEADSRNQLYSFLRGQKFTMTPEGKLIMYKGVHDSGMVDGKRVFESMHSGHAFVNGKEINGRVPQSVGDIVEMPRSEVTHDPGAACSVGLHAATFQFAANFVGHGSPILELEVDPRDVVSVPRHDREKVRVSRYKVLGVVSAARKEAVRREVSTAQSCDSPPYAPDARRQLGLRTGSISAPKVESGGNDRRRVEEHKPKAQVTSGKKQLEGPKVKHPSAAVFTEFQIKAKMQKTGIIRFCEKHGLRYLGGDKNSRKSYEVVTKS